MAHSRAATPQSQPGRALPGHSAHPSGVPEGRHNSPPAHSSRPGSRPRTSLVHYPFQQLSNARGSLMELETQIIIASSLDFIAPEQMEEISDEIEQIAKMLNALINAIRAR